MIVYYFFDSVQKKSLSLYIFLRSILHQLLRIELINSTLQRRLEVIFTESNENRKSKIHKLKILILKLCNTMQKMIIVIDDINEVKQDD